MAITVKSNSFYLRTDNSSYIFCIEDGFPVHLYYGAKIDCSDIRYLIDRQIYSFCPQKDDSTLQPAATLIEYSGFNTGDYRTCAISVDAESGLGCRLLYSDYEILSGAPVLCGLPYSRGKDCETLVIKLRDDEKSIIVRLYYAVFEKENVIARHVEIINDGKIPITLKKAASAQVDFVMDGDDFDTIYLSGSVNDEFNIQRSKLVPGIYKTGSTKGFTSHDSNTFFCVCDACATEDNGDAYGFNLLYSGSFSNEIELDELRKVRFVSGINPDNFEWRLDGGEKFVTPQAILTYSENGIGGVSRNFHNHIRNRIVPQKFVHEPRPIVVNTWEAFGVSVCEADVLRLADVAKKTNIDTIVLDDGWFRGDNRSGLGEWREDLSKFPSGIAGLAEKVRAKGLKFGLWIEPEMVSCDSELARTKPEWLLGNGNEGYEWRYQKVLDFASPEVVEYVYRLIGEILRKVKPDYVKWDANRYISEAGSRSGRVHGEVWHRYMLGVYSLLDKLTSEFSDVLFESCAGGGGRVDPGMMFYTPQIWISDNTYPFRRNKIQTGASLAYPPSVMSSHFTAARNVDSHFRYLVASFGAYGYEFDITKLDDDKRKEIAAYAETYRKEEKFVLEGDLYRIGSNPYFQADVEVLPDKSAALVRFLLFDIVQGRELAHIRMKGLDPNAVYKNSCNGLLIRGDVLMKAGFFISDLNCAHPTNQGRDLFFNETKVPGGGMKILFEKV